MGPVHRPYICGAMNKTRLSIDQTSDVKQHMIFFVSFFKLVFRSHVLPLKLTEIFVIQCKFFVEMIREKSPCR